MRNLPQLARLGSYKRPIWRPAISFVMGFGMGWGAAMLKRPN